MLKYSQQCVQKYPYLEISRVIRMAWVSCILKWNPGPKRWIISAYQSLDVVATLVFIFQTKNIITSPENTSWSCQKWSILVSSCEIAMGCWFRPNCSCSRGLANSQNEMIIWQSRISSGWTFRFCYTFFGWTPHDVIDQIWSCPYFGQRCHPRDPALFFTSCCTDLEAVVYGEQWLGAGFVVRCDWYGYESLDSKIIDLSLGTFIFLMCLYFVHFLCMSRGTISIEIELN